MRAAKCRAQSIFQEVIDLPYGRQNVTEADIEAVSMVLRSDWLTTARKSPNHCNPQRITSAKRCGIHTIISSAADKQECWL